ncbi:MAG: hypothetical protein JSR91_04525 [Proteobacteria bacterium]|nr:hypothetical protein [Pseudomonadota bacterium]
MSDALLHNPHDIPVNSRAAAWQGFVILVSIATVLPFIVAPLTEQVIPEGTPGFLVFATISLLGANFHVATTGWFYFDPEMRAHFVARPLRYVVVPLLLVGGMGLAFAVIDHVLRSYIIVAHTGWLLWHYQKQNVGLSSFVAAGTDRIPLSIWERRTLILAALPGILGVYSILKIMPAGWTNETVQQLHWLGLATYGLVAVAFCITMVRTAALRTNLLRLAFFLSGTLFFLPSYLFSNPIAANSGYAIAHGLQYLVFMGVVSIDRKRLGPTLFKLLVIAVVGCIALDQAMAAPAWLSGRFGMVIYGMFFGAVMSHFVLDAGIWRLREPFQRNYMRRKFAFVFER